MTNEQMQKRLNDTIDTLIRTEKDFMRKVKHTNWRPSEKARALGACQGRINDLERLKRLVEASDWALIEQVWNG